MQYLTEQDLMARCGLGQGVELHLSPEERLTPSAQELVNNRKIRILIVSGDGRVARDDGKAVHPLATEERPFAKVEKTEAQTHLNGTEMVTKEHPRIWFRGKVDSAITAAILVQTQLQPCWRRSCRAYWRICVRGSGGPCVAKCWMKPCPY